MRKKPWIDGYWVIRTTKYLKVPQSTTKHSQSTKKHPKVPQSTKKYQKNPAQEHPKVPQSTVFYGQNNNYDKKVLFSNR